MTTDQAARSTEHFEEARMKVQEYGDDAGQQL
jgi:hypothetical protein